MFCLPFLTVLLICVHKPTLYVLLLQCVIVVLQAPYVLLAILVMFDWFLQTPCASFAILAILGVLGPSSEISLKYFLDKFLGESSQEPPRESSRKSFGESS